MDSSRTPGRFFCWHILTSANRCFAWTVVGYYVIVSGVNAAVATSNHKKSQFSNDPNIDADGWGCTMKSWNLQPWWASIAFKITHKFQVSTYPKLALETSRYPNSSSGWFFSRAQSDATGMMVSRPSYPKINRYQNIMLFFDIYVYVYIYSYKISVPNTVGNMFVSLVILNRLWSLVYFLSIPTTQNWCLEYQFFGLLQKS